MGRGSGRPGGNPDFGTKYKYENGGTERLSEQVKAQILPKTKLELKAMADEKNCTVPELVRAAIERYLADARSGSAA